MSWIINDNTHAIVENGERKIPKPLIVIFLNDIQVICNACGEYTLNDQFESDYPVFTEWISVLSERVIIHFINIFR